MSKVKSNMKPASVACIVSQNYILKYSCTMQVSPC